jgi:radical SAM superfamily enzyme
MMIETAKYLNKFNLFGLKIHMLHIMKNTPLAEIYEKEKFKVLSLTEFTEVTTEQLRHINTKTVIQRLTGDAPKDLLIEPFWTLKKFVVLNEIDKHMRKMNIYQGDLC